MALFFEGADPSYVANISRQLITNWNSIGAVAPELPNNIVGFVESFEVKGHFVARQALRALELIRRSWGWYINHPSSTGSTCIEGYLADGTFGYRDKYGYGEVSYTSHAHGWSTGPTDALTSFVVGLTPTGPAGREWQLAPQFGDLANAEGGFTTPLGKFSAKWELADGGYSVSWDTPPGTEGVVILSNAEGATNQPSVVIDGKSRSLVKGDYDAATGLTTIRGSGQQRAIVTFV